MKRWVFTYYQDGCQGWGAFITDTQSMSDAHDEFRAAHPDAERVTVRHIPTNVRQVKRNDK